MQIHEVLRLFRGGRGLIYGALDLWPGGVGSSLCSGETVLGWGGTLGRGAEPPTALRVPHRQLPTAPGVGALGWVECREHIFGADYILYNCVCDNIKMILPSH